MNRLKCDLSRLEFLNLPSCLICTRRNILRQFPTSSSVPEKSQLLLDFVISSTMGLFLTGLRAFKATRSKNRVSLFEQRESQNPLSL